MAGISKRSPEENNRTRLTTIGCEAVLGAIHPRVLMGSGSPGPNGLCGYDKKRQHEKSTTHSQFVARSGGRGWTEALRRKPGVSRRRAPTPATHDELENLVLTKHSSLTMSGVGIPAGSLIQAVRCRCKLLVQKASSQGITAGCRDHPWATACGHTHSVAATRCSPPQPV